MHQNDDDNWLEGAFLAQEEYDSNKDKWKGRQKEMEDHFLSAYDTLPDTHDYETGSHESSGSAQGNSAWIVVLIVLAIMFFCAISTLSFR